MDGEQFPDHVDGATSFGTMWAVPAPPGSDWPEARCRLVDCPGGTRYVAVDVDGEGVALTGGQLREVASDQVLDWLDPDGADSATGKPEGWDDVPPPEQLAFGLIGLGIVADSARGLDAAGRVAAVIVAGGILAAHLDERPEDTEILRLAGAAINEALQDDDEPVPADPVAAACRLMTADHDKSFWLGRRRLTEALGASDLCTTEELLSALAVYVAKGGGSNAFAVVDDWILPALPAGERSVYRSQPELPMEHYDSGTMLPVRLDPDVLEELREAAPARLVVYLVPDEESPETGAEPAAVCGWREDESGDFWHTCADPWVFPDAGGPQENRMRLCPMCGKPLQFTPAIG